MPDVPPDFENAMQAALDNALKGVGAKIILEVRQEMRGGLDQICSLLDSRGGNAADCIVKAEPAQPVKLNGAPPAALEASYLTVEPYSKQQLGQISVQGGGRGRIEVGYAPLATSDGGTTDAQESPPGWLESVVQDARFEYSAGMVVLLNAVFIGIETNADCRYNSHPPASQEVPLEIGEAIFMCLFLTEWLMRVCVYGWRWFCDDRCRAAWFDTFLVSTQVIDQVVIWACIKGVNLSLIGLVRLLRLLRILRLVRLLHLFDELGLLVDSITAAISALCWAVLLMMCILYASSIFFARLAMQATNRTPHIGIFFRRCSPHLSHPAGMHCGRDQLGRASHGIV